MMLGCSRGEVIVEFVRGLGAGGTDAPVLCCQQQGQEGSIKLYGQRSIALALTLPHAQEWKHLGSDRRGSLAVGWPIFTCLSSCDTSPPSGGTRWGLNPVPSSLPPSGVSVGPGLFPVANATSHGPCKSCSAGPCVRYEWSPTGLGRSMHRCCQNKGPCSAGVLLLVRHLWEE